MGQISLWPRTVSNIKIYQDSVDVPDEYKEITAKLKKRAQEVRFEYIQRRKPARRKTTGNVAVAHLMISNGEIIRKEATSKKDPMNRPTNEQMPEGYTGPLQHFEPYPNPSQSGTPLNIEHAEYKVLNALADAKRLPKVGLGEAQQTADALRVEGSLILYTEKKMCLACQNAARDAMVSFRRRFRELKLIVIWTYPYG